jgi:hypothetical protein
MARAQVGWREKRKSQVAINIEQSPGFSRGVMSVLPLPVSSGSAQLCLAGTLKLQLYPRRPGKPEMKVIRSQASL